MVPPRPLVRRAPSLASHQAEVEVPETEGLSVCLVSGGLAVLAANIEQ